MNGKRTVRNDRLQRDIKSGMEITYTFTVLTWCMLTRNLQKKAKKVRHQEEKRYMEALAEAGQQVGQYVGNGQGEMEVELPTVAVEDDFEVECQDEGNASRDRNESGAGGSGGDWDEGGSRDSGGTLDEGGGNEGSKTPLLILYDCETTGFSIYDEHIIEVAAKIINCPTVHNGLTFSSLVRTARRIQAKGKFTINPCSLVDTHSIAVKVHKIRATMLLGEKPLSIVLPELIKWISTVTADVSEATGSPHYPGKKKNITSSDFNFSV